MAIPLIMSDVQKTGSYQEVDTKWGYMIRGNIYKCVQRHIPTVLSLKNVRQFGKNAGNNVYMLSIQVFLAFESFRMLRMA